MNCIKNECIKKIMYKNEQIKNELKKKKNDPVAERA